jgi:HEAT repeat protein
MPVAGARLGGYCHRLMGRDDLAGTLTSLFDAERAARKAHDELADADRERIEQLLAGAVKDATAIDDEAEAALRLVRIANLLGEFEGPRIVDLLIDVLGCDQLEVREAAGEALSGLAFDRFKEVALGVERALRRLPEGNAALAELPYLLAEVPEPGVMKLLAGFLARHDADAVASAIEALVEIGDASALPLLDPLAGDARRVQLEDDGGSEGEATIGDLVTEARALLGRGTST